jgi:F-type H+-transporting ATPase subunit delta
MAKASRRALAKIVAERLSAANADQSAIIREVAAYLLDNKMTEHADAFINDLAEELYNQTGKLVVEVTSARQLSDEARDNLVKYLQESGDAKTVELHESVDESLIGGLIAKTPSAELDISLRNTLRQLTSII